MSHAKHIRFLFAIALFTAIVPFSAFAQSSTGSISGAVSDGAGGLLPGVTITAVNIAMGLSRTSVSNAAGHYDVPLLPPGTYSVSSELSGFQPTKYERIVVNVGTDSAVNFKLNQGVIESVTARGAQGEEDARTEKGGAARRPALAFRCSVTLKRFA